MTKINPVFNLNSEEQAIHGAVVRGGYSSVPDLEAEKNRIKEVARNTLAKNKAITIRVSERNLMRLKAAAAREGIPYQTYISSLIQKYT